MKFKQITLLLLLSIISITTQAQDKVKGSRNVTVEQTPVDTFSAIDIGENFEVVIVKGTTPVVEIEADDNLHEIIDISVIDNTLFLHTTKEIKRKKALRVRITFTEELSEIRTKEKAEVSGLTDLTFSTLQITTSGSSKFFGTIQADEFSITSNDGSKVELNIRAENVSFQLNQKSKINALVNSTDFKIDLLEDGKAKIEGDTHNLTLRADNGSEFTGSNLTTQNTSVIIEGRSQASVRVATEITITARGKTKLSIFGAPKFNIEAFEGEASLLKQE